MSYTGIFLLILKLLEIHSNNFLTYSSLHKWLSRGFHHPRPERLLQLNLFEKRDLMALLRGDPPLDCKTAINQMALL